MDRLQGVPQQLFVYFIHGAAKPPGKFLLLFTIKKKTICYFWSKSKDWITAYSGAIKV
jgi:hypothetical protein